MHGRVENAAVNPGGQPREGMIHIAGPRGDNTTDKNSQGNDKILNENTPKGGRTRTRIGRERPTR